MTTRITQDHPPRLPPAYEYARHLDRVATKAQPSQADEPMGRLDRALLSVLLCFAALALLFVVASYAVANFIARHRERILDGFIALTVCLTLYFFLT